MYITTPQRRWCVRVSYLFRATYQFHPRKEQNGNLATNTPNKSSSICFQPPRKSEFLRCATCIDHISMWGKSWNCISGAKIRKLLIFQDLQASPGLHLQYRRTPPYNYCTLYCIHYCTFSAEDVTNHLRLRGSIPSSFQLGTGRFELHLWITEQNRPGVFT